MDSPVAAAPSALRLPGIRFEAIRPRRADVLPRMDIACFVGFAASGPLHVPVPVEDAAEFTAIFGEDLPLAWDAARGETEYACLGPTVRAFFRNGGRRCWVIRVADDFTAHTAHFPIPGLAQVNAAQQITPAFAAARSPGSWGDAIQTSAALSSQPLRLLGFDIANQTLDLELNRAGDVIVGDLLRVEFATDGWVIYFFVTGLDVLPGDKAPSRAQAYRLRARADIKTSAGINTKAIYWFRPQAALTPEKLTGTLTAFTHAGPLPAIPVTVPANSWPADNESPVLLDYVGKLSPAWRAASDPGALLQVKFKQGETFWLRITGQSESDDQPALLGVGERMRFSGQGVWQPSLPPNLSTFSDPTPYVEKLTFELWARTAQNSPWRLTDLGFAPGHPRFWASLPNDEQLYTTYASATTGDASFKDLLANPDYSKSASLLADGPYADLWRTSLSPRFPLAGSENPGGSQPEAAFLPLLLPIIPNEYANTDEPDGDALSRDGLASFHAGLFADPELAGLLSEAISGMADDIRYLRGRTRRLRGLHAALGVDEVTLISAPDAIQRGWDKVEQNTIPPVQPSLPPERPAWWSFLPCHPSPAQLPRTSQPEWGKFLRCGLRIIPAPVLTASQPDASGSFALTWTAIPKLDNCVYVLEESAFADWSAAREVYRGPLTTFIFYGYSQGDYYFRVRVEIASPPDALVETSDYSNGVGIRIAPGTTWVVKAEDDYAAKDLVAIQRMLLRLAACRGDLFAVLAQPAHFRAADSAAHVLGLRSPLAAAITVSVPDLNNPGVSKPVSIAALGYGEGRALTFGAIYHPWLVATDGESADVHRLPPDGFAAGVIARRSYERGAWIAPANEPLRGVVGLLPLIPATHWLDLQTAKVNLLRDEPQGYLCLSASTLSDDPDWTLINVRRLISLLRRLATRYGPTFVFEPNSDAFRRLVQREFSALLDGMFARGAFAGATPETSYQVSVPVTPQDIDAGRFIVELRVAPSLPMRFITVRLVQSGEGSVVTG
jgi:hypothetical protein